MRYANPYKTAATAYSRLGFAPIPVHADGPRAKTPAVRGHHGRDAKWPSMDTIEMWERTRGEYNVAIVLPRNVIGIDVDGYAGHAGAETLVELERELGPLPPTYISTARDDGISGIRLYHVPDDIEWPGKAGDGIDVICWYERYVICWPSYHSGVKDIYRWWQQTRDGPTPVEFPDPEFLPELPRAWIDHLATVGGGPTPRGQVDDVVAWIRENGAGKMCRQMTHTLGHWLGRIAEATDAGGIHEDGRDGVKALLGDCAAGHTGLWSALARLRSAFLEAIATRSRRRNGPEEWRGFVRGGVEITIPIMTGAEDTCGQESGLPTREDIARLQAGSRREVAKSILASLIVGGRQIRTNRHKPLRWAIPELIPEGLTVLGGAPKVGKSILMLQIALECSRGGVVFGLDVERRPVCYFALEDSERRIQSRSAELLGGKSHIPDDVTFLFRLGKMDMVSAVEAWLAANPNGILLIDTLGRAMAANRVRSGESAYDRDYRVMSTIFDLVTYVHPGSFAVLSHHTKKTNKPTDDWLSLISGTNAVTGGLDTAMLLTRDGRNSPDGILHVLGRDVDNGEYSMNIEQPRGWALHGSDLGEARDLAELRAERNQRRPLGERMNELISFVENTDGEVDRSMVAEALGISDKDASNYLRKAHERGHIMRTGLGKYAAAGKLATTTTNVNKGS